MLEYDWEQPDRHYFYRFTSSCKKFKYLFTTPKELVLYQKVVYMDIGTGEKRYARNPTSVNYLPDRTEIRREASNLQAP